MVYYPAGHPYHQVKKRQKQRKLSLITKKTKAYLKGLKRAGLEPVSLIVRTAEGKDLDLNLSSENKRHIITPARSKVNDDTKKALLHTLMRFNISVQSYHEIASLFPNSLPRAHEVSSSYIYIYIYICNI